MHRPKQISDSAIIGQLGVNLIERTVLEMGYTWHATGALEAGIDGYIEIRGSSGEVSNCIIQVQSRATEREFARETPTSFEYVCEELHKSSSYSPGEIEGFVNALKTQRIETSDFVSLGSADVRLFRSGFYPPLRGTYLELDKTNSILYTRGSVEFFSTYPGMYVPHPLLIRSERSDQPQTLIAAEILALTKMNWNKTQFDGADPITMHAARQVGQILKYVPAAGPIGSRYSSYM